MTNDDGGLGHIQIAGAGESLCVRIAVCGGRLQDLRYLAQLVDHHMVEDDPKPQPQQ